MPALAEVQVWRGHPAYGAPGARERGLRPILRDALTSALEDVGSAELVAPQERVAAAEGAS
jgi:hypothetical protein